MILALSRFRITNQREADVVRAFHDRPRLVEQAPGFLGMEVYSQAEDPASFFLITRWTDVASFETWHKSEAHQKSHQQIPRGLKIDKNSVQLIILQEIREPANGASAFTLERAFSQADIELNRNLSRFLLHSPSNYCLLVDRDGILRDLNEALAARLEQPREQILGRPLEQFLTADEGPRLRQYLEEIEHRPNQVLFLVNFVNASRYPFTLECWAEVRNGMTLLVGTDPSPRGETSPENLLHLNNELAVLNRENARQARELEQTKAQLEKTLKDLETSHWHLRKLQEVLPICMECGKVKAGAEWESVVDYLKKNALFLSHGYCPACLEQVHKKWGLGPK